MIKILLLGLLNKEPLHGYAISQYLKKGSFEKWTNILPNSIYNGLKKLELSRFIRIKGTEMVGQRIRYIYEITSKGVAEYEKLLKESLSDFKRVIPSDLYIILTLLGDLNETQILNAINNKIYLVQNEIDSWRNGQLKKTSDPGYAKHMNKLFENGLMHLNADLELFLYIKDNVSEILKIMKNSRG